MNIFWTRQAMFVLPPQLQHGKASEKVEQKTRVDGFFSVCVFHPALTRRSPLCIALKTGRCFSKPGKLHAEQREPWKHRFAWAFPLEHWLQRISCERCSWIWFSMAACVFLLECLIFCSTKKQAIHEVVLRIMGVWKKYVVFLAFVCQVKQWLLFCFFFSEGHMIESVKGVSKRPKVSRRFKALKQKRRTKQTSALLIWNPTWYQQREAEGDLCFS